MEPKLYRHTAKNKIRQKFYRVNEEPTMFAVFCFKSANETLISWFATEEEALALVRFVNSLRTLSKFVYAEMPPVTTEEVK